MHCSRRSCLRRGRAWRRCRWDETYNWHGTLREFTSEPLQVQCWDYDFGSIRNDHLGDAKVDLSALQTSRHLECSALLADQQARPGEVSTIRSGAARASRGLREVTRASTTLVHRRRLPSLRAQVFFSFIWDPDGVPPFNVQQQQQQQPPQHRVV